MWDPRAGPAESQKEAFCRLAAAPLWKGAPWPGCGVLCNFPKPPVPQLLSVEGGSPGKFLSYRFIFRSCPVRTPVGFGEVMGRKCLSWGLSDMRGIASTMPAEAGTPGPLCVPYLWGWSHLPTQGPQLGQS